MIATVLAWIVVVLHLLFGAAESIGWSGMARRFGYNREQTQTTRVLALNQGAYNAGIACLLAWALVTGQGATVVALLAFVVAMAIVGAVSASWSIILVQGLPALLALAATLWMPAG